MRLLFAPRQMGAGGVTEGNYCKGSKDIAVGSVWRGSCYPGENKGGRCPGRCPEVGDVRWVSEIY
ncbi:MAG: hypothetical protein ABW185_02870 [Sedimenticola sp.]